MTDSLFDLVRDFDRLLGSNDSQFTTPPEFVLNIFSHILNQTRRSTLQPSKPHKVHFAEKEDTKEEITKPQQQSVRSKLPRKPKQPKPKKQSKEEINAIYAQHTKKWQDLRQIEQPPPYTTCRSQPTTVDLSQ